MHFVYSVCRNDFISCFQCFNVNLIFSSFFQFFIFLSNAIIGGTSSGPVCLYDLILFLDLFHLLAKCSFSSS